MLSTPRFLSRAAGLVSRRSASTKIKDLAHKTVNTIGRDMLASTDDALDQFNDIGAADIAEVALAPFGQNVEGEVPPIFFGGAWPLMALGMFLEVASGQRTKRPRVRRFSLGRARLNGVNSSLDLSGNGRPQAWCWDMSL
jgi:hypothetical protein